MASVRTNYFLYHVTYAVNFGKTKFYWYEEWNRNIEEAFDFAKKLILQNLSRRHKESFFLIENKSSSKDVQQIETKKKNFKKRKTQLLIPFIGKISNCRRLKNN